MNDEVNKIEGDAKATLAHVDEVIHSDALKAKATVIDWLKAHLWIVAVAGLVVGLIVGHFLHR